jgi:ribosomal protein S18 acetylase RimI-like enzyme
VLERAGLVLVGREPLMACAPADFKPAAAAGVAVRALHTHDPDADLAAYLAIRDEDDEGLEQPGQTPRDEEIVRLRQSIAAGVGWFALATLDGEPAGTGHCQTSANASGEASGNGSADGLGELTAIVTLRALRRRGVAATVTSFLVRQHFAAGGMLAWLSAANDGARSVYARVGFRALGSLLNYEEPAAHEQPTSA